MLFSEYYSVNILYVWCCETLNVATANYGILYTADKKKKVT